MKIEQRLKELNITLPKVDSPLGNYVHAKRVGNLLYLSGKGPESADGSMPRGKMAPVCQSKRDIGTPAR